MAPKVPGKHNREGLALKMVMEICPDDDTVRKWFEGGCRLDGPFCPKAVLSTSSIRSSAAR